MLLPRFKLHPASVREIKSGHFWVTKDKFSEQFKKAKHFFIGLDHGNKPVGVFLNDPSHKNIKARFWKEGSNYTPSEFFSDLEKRIATAISKRKATQFNRNNYFLVFAEADNLPGLEILKLDNNIIIKIYTEFWTLHIPTIVNILNKSYKNSCIWKHHRTKGSNTFPELISGKKEHHSKTVEEFSLKYYISLGESYDYGIYTDASSIRENLTDYFKKADRFLNLFSYTGAFSLYAKEQNPKAKVTSVDLSDKYLAVLKENIKLNQQNLEDHELQCMSAFDSIELFKNKAQSFDLILIDPPPSSSDKKKILSSIQSYPEYIKKLDQILTKDGKMILLLNHRSTNREKFKKVILKSIKDFNLKLNITHELGLSDDCSWIKNFPESDYLKGFILERD